MNEVVMCPNHDALPDLQEIQESLSPGSVHLGWNAMRTWAGPQWHPGIKYYDLATNPEMQTSFRVQRKANDPAIFGPIRRLSPELLSRIFMHCLPPGDVHSLCEYIAPLVLGQVCRFWRNVAVSTPALWSTLCVNLDKTGDFNNAANLILTWLSRSGALMLSLTLVADSNERFSMTHLVLKWIMAYAHRWENLEFCGSRTQLDAILGEPGRFPNLRWLELWMPIEGDGLEPPMTIFTPKLKTLCIKWPFVLDQGYPWEDLSHQQITEQRLGHCLSLIRSAPMLQICKIEGFEDYIDSFVKSCPPSSALVLSNIRSLHLHQLCFDLARYLISSLVLPKLTELHLILPSHAQPQIDLAFLAHRSQFSLRKLVLKCGDSKCVGCGQFSASLQGVEQLDYLEELEVCFGGDSWENEQFINRLTYRCAGAPVLLRSLQVLTLHGLCKTSERALVDMIKSRWKVNTSFDTIARLRSVHLRFYVNANEGQMERLRKYGRQGLNVVLERGFGTRKGFTWTSAR